MAIMTGNLRVFIYDVLTRSALFEFSLSDLLKVDLAATSSRQMSSGSGSASG